MTTCLPPSLSFFLSLYTHKHKPFFFNFDPRHSRTHMAMSTAVMRMTRTPPTTATTITSKLLLPPVTAVDEDGVSTHGHKGTQSSHSPHTSHTFREASGDRRYPTTLYPILDTHTMPHAFTHTVHAVLLHMQTSKNGVLFQTHFKQECNSQNTHSPDFNMSHVSPLYPSSHSHMLFCKGT